MSRHGSAMASPVYLQQRTYLVTAGMAVECQDLTRAPQQTMFTGCNDLLDHLVRMCTAFQPMAWRPECLLPNGAKTGGLWAIERL